MTASPEQSAGLPPLGKASRLGISGRVLIEQRVALEPEHARSQVDAWLRRQVFEPHARVGDTQDWLPGGGMGARVRRMAHGGSRRRLKDVTRLQVQVEPAAVGARVRLLAELLDTRRGALVGGIAPPGALAGVLAAGVLAVPDLAALTEGVAIAVAVAGGSGAGYVGTRRFVAARRAVVAEELALALQGLGAAPERPGPGLPPWAAPMLDKWKRRRDRT